MAETKDIAEILRKREPEKYKAIIERAELNGYHDYKFMKIPGHPEYGKCNCPKVQLLEDLSPFPELEDIQQRVIKGEFDERADTEDTEEMRGWLMDDDSPDKMFEVLGFKVPTNAERMLRKKNRRKN